MQKRQLNVQLESTVIGKLNKIGERYGMSANVLIAAAACELARVRPENLWHALGRIAQGETLEVLPDDREALPAPKPARRLRAALPA